MPSTGFPMEDFDDALEPEVDWTISVKIIENNAKRAMQVGLFIEWLECFVGAYNKIKDDPRYGHALIDRVNVASQAGIIEWDM